MRCQKIRQRDEECPVVTNEAREVFLVSRSRIWRNNEVKSQKQGI